MLRYVVHQREGECCGFIAPGGLVGDPKFGRRKDGRELLAVVVPPEVKIKETGWEVGQANEQLVIDGIDISTLEDGDVLRICSPQDTDKASSIAELRCRAVAEKLMDGMKRTTCVDLVYREGRKCGSGGIFLGVQDEHSIGVVCGGDRIRVIKAPHKEEGEEY